MICSTVARLSTQSEFHYPSTINNTPSHRNLLVLKEETEPVQMALMQKNWPVDYERQCLIENLNKLFTYNVTGSILKTNVVFTLLFAVPSCAPQDGKCGINQS